MWSDELPKKDGWYWIRGTGDGGKTSGLVVNVMAGWVHGVLSASPVKLEKYDTPEIEWYGPFECPE